MHSRKIVFAMVLAGLIFITAGAYSATAPQISYGDREIFTVNIPAIEVKDGSWSYNGVIELLPGLFRDAKYQKVVFKLNNNEIGAIEACWASDGNPVYNTENLIAFCYQIYDNTGTKGIQSEQIKAKYAYSESSNYTVPRKISFGNFSFDIQAGASVYDTSDFVKISNLTINGLNGGTNPEPILRDNEQYIDIPPKEITTTGAWSYSQTIELKPQLFPDKKAQKLVFRLNNKEIGAIEACWSSDSRPVNRVQNNQIAFCYQIYDNTGTKGIQSGQIKAEYVYYGNSGYTMPRKISFGNFSFDIQAGFTGTYDSGEFIKISGLTISGLNGGTNPEPILRDNEQYIDIPKDQIKDGTWNYAETIELKPGFFPDKKAQKLVFRLNGQWIIELGACWYSNNEPTGRFSHLFGTDEFGYCYWITDYSTKNSDGTPITTGEIREKKYILPSTNNTNYFTISKGNFEARMQVVTDAVTTIPNSTNDTLKLKEIKITGLKSESLSGLTVSVTTPDAGLVAGQPIAFEASVPGFDASQVTFVWNFGDGTELARGKTATHSYTKPEEYTVTVEASLANNTAGGSATNVIKIKENLEVCSTSQPECRTPTDNILGALFKLNNWLIRNLGLE